MHNPEQDIAHIKNIMERSSRFISLSGKSGVAAGSCALVGAAVAYYLMQAYYSNYQAFVSNPVALRNSLVVVALITLLAAAGLSFFFTYQKSKKQGIALWGYSTQQLVWYTLLPMMLGGVYILYLVSKNYYAEVAPLCLLFYGLGLVSGSRYTVGEVRYLGYVSCVLGIINLFFPKHGLLFWALSFGVAHIVYGIAMWYKYDATSTEDEEA